MLVSKIYVSRTEIKVEKVTSITSGMVGAEVDVFFDRSWNGYAKTYVWEHNGVTKVDAKCSGIIPPEAVAESGGHLRFGVYGTKDGKATPTLWCNVDTVKNGTEPTGDESTNSTLPVWAQIREMVGNLDDLDTEAKENLVAAVNEALVKGGGSGGAGADGEDGGYYTPDVTQPSDTTMEVAFTPSKADMPTVDPVTITLPVSSDSSQNANAVEPAEDDIPKVYFTGTLPTSKDEGDLQLFMRYVSKTARHEYPVTLKVQGSSSANYAKKNFTLKPYKDSTYESKKKLAFKNWPEMNKFVLKAHWVDHSHVRNVGTAKIWGKIVASRSDYDSLPEELRNAPNNGATDGFTCKVFCNGVYQGLYEWIVPKDKLFGQDSDIATHSILNSELNNQPTCAFATTSPKIGGNWSEELQDSMSSDISTSFANLIKFVAGSTDDEFVANAENYFDVQSVIDYNIFARIFCIVDNLCRNQIFFTYDGTKWYEGCWDVDAVLGLHPTAGDFFAYDTEFQTGYVAYRDFGITNLLYQRVETLFVDRFKARYAELRADVLSVDNVIEVYERLTDVITTYDGLLDEDYASTTGGGAFTGIPHKTANSIQQIRDFVAQRIPYMDEQIVAMSVPVPCTGISLSANALTFTEEGTQTLTATVSPDGCTDPVVWESDNVNVATVENGVVTAIANGSAVITATCGEYSASCSVSISGIAEPVACTGITLDKSELSFTEEGSQTIVATVTPSDTTDKVVWSSENEAVATVENGVVTAVSDGSTNIIATCGNQTAKCSVSVALAASPVLYQVKNHDMTKGITDTGIKLLAEDIDFTITADFSVTGMGYNTLYTTNLNGPNAQLNFTKNSVQSNYMSYYDAGYIGTQYTAALSANIGDGDRFKIVHSHKAGSGSMECYIRHIDADAGTDKTYTGVTSGEVVSTEDTVKLYVNQYIPSLYEFTISNYAMTADEANTWLAAE